MAVLNGYDVGVVGAGFAGLSAAVRLAREGARVLVLEARSRLGGRATAFADRETGEIVDNGQHLLLGWYTETFSFLEEIGALGNVLFPPQLSVPMVDRAGRSSRLTAGGSLPLPPPLHLIAGAFEWDALSWTDRLAIVRMAAPIRIGRRALQGRSRRIAASPGETVENWLIRNGQTARLREMLWDPLALAALNQRPDRAAAPVFARVLAEMFGSDPKASAIVIPTKPLDVMYAEPARQYIERRRGTVRTSMPTWVRITGDRATSVVSGNDEWSMAAVVSAVPWYALGEVIPHATGELASVLASAHATAACPIVTVHLWFDQRLIDEPFLGLPGREMQWLVDKSVAFGDAAGHLSLASSGGASLIEKPNNEIIELAYQELLDARPAARTAHLLRATVVREPRATFSLAPGQPPRPSTATGVSNLFLAGDWIDTGLPATIESAVRSGHRAAELVTGSSSRS